MPGFKRALLAALLFIGIAKWASGQPAALTMDDFRPHGGNWRTASAAAVSPRDPKLLELAPGSGLLVNGEAGKTTNLLTAREFGDVEVYVEFLIPQGSNSGVYLQGRYEVQIRDSHGVDAPRHADAGGVYQRWDEAREPKGWGGVPPLVNAARPAGEWQSMGIIFRAPRFDRAGRKTEDAVLVQAVLNGQVVQRDVTLSGPTRAATYMDERALGPIMLQGDHGPVAFRNLRVRELDLDHAGMVIGQWEPLDLKNDFDIVIGDEVPGATAEEVFEIKEDEIHAMYRWNRDGRTPSGLFVSKQRYSRFDLEFEIKAGERGFEPRVDKPKNGGFLYHIQGTTPIWPPCLELQGMETNRGDHWSIRGVDCHQLTPASTLVEVPRRPFSRAMKWFSPETPGWNRMRIEVRGDAARYFVSGQLVNEIRQAVYGGQPCTAGFIGFQAEHGEMIYRNLRIRHVGYH